MAIRVAAILISLSTFENYCHCQKNKEPAPQELEILFDLALLKPRLVLVLPMLLLHTSGIPFLQKYEQLRRIPSFAKNYRHTSLHLVFHHNSLTSCCSYFYDFDWPCMDTILDYTSWFEAPRLSLSYRYRYRFISAIGPAACEHTIQYNTNPIICHGVWR